MENQLVIRPYQNSDENSVVSLWEIVFPESVQWNNPIKDIHLKLTIQSHLFIVALSDSKLIGTVMGGFDGHRGWIYYLAVHPDHRRQGFGSQLLKAIEKGLKELGCPKVNLQIRSDNHRVESFYHKCGYDTEERISMGKRIK